MKGDVPHGLGKWKRDDDRRTVEGEWQDGFLNGRVVANLSNGDYEYYEAQDEKVNGKSIWYKSDGGCEQAECKDGKYHGRRRKYNKHGAITSETIWENG